MKSLQIGLLGLFIFLSVGFRANIGFWKPEASLGTPSNLSIAHSSGQRIFNVTWTGGSGNGGAGGCRLEYFRNETTWTAITGTYNCDTNVTGTAVSLPTTTSWTNNFNSTGVQVRLVRVSDSLVLGVFPTRLTCSGVAGSSSPTPNRDEDCNGIWDNSVISSCNTCTFYEKSYDQRVLYESSGGLCSGASIVVPASIPQTLRYSSLASCNADNSCDSHLNVQCAAIGDGDYVCDTTRVYTACTARTEANCDWCGGTYIYY